MRKFFVQIRSFETEIAYVQPSFNLFMKSIFVTALFITGMQLYAQKPEDFHHDGYVVLHGTTDTIYGKIKPPGTANAMNHHVWFMYPDGRMWRFKIKELEAWKMMDELYIIGRDLPGKNGTKSLLVLETGTVTLYECSKSVMSYLDVVYFLMREGQEEMLDIPNGRYTSEGYIYYPSEDLDKFYDYFEHDPVISDKIRNEVYKIPMLQAVVREYNSRHPHLGKGLHY